MDDYLEIIRVLHVPHYRMVDCLFVCTRTKELLFFLLSEIAQVLEQWSNGSHRKMVGCWTAHKNTSSRHLAQVPKHRGFFGGFLLPS